MIINGKTKVCGLIGNPVEHSVSPLIHNTLSQMLGINLAYVTFKVSQGEVAKAVEGAYALNIQGLNVTVPHKQEVIGVLRDTDPLAESIGAVNTLVRVPGGYKGYNTDILGLKRSMELENVSVKNREVIILGAGGASRAIAFLCATEGADKIYLLNRTLKKAEDIAYAVNSHMGRNVIYPMELSDYGLLNGEAYICIQTTSVGLHPNDGDAPISDRSFYDRIQTGIDIIYNPYETQFMKNVKMAGGQAFNGLKMLLYQGIAAYELWNDVAVSRECADKVYEVLKKELGVDG